MNNSLILAMPYGPTCCLETTTNQRWSAFVDDFAVAGADDDPEDASDALAAAIAVAVAAADCKGSGSSDASAGTDRIGTHCGTTAGANTRSRQRWGSGK